MAAAKHNITAEQGTTFYLNFQLKSDGVGWNLSNYEGRMQVRPSVDASETYLSLSTTTDEITMDSSGNVAVTVDADTMADVIAGRHVYDFEVESSGGEVWRVIEGKFVVKAEVTR